MIDRDRELGRAGLAVAAAADAPGVVLWREEHFDEGAAPLIESCVGETLRDGFCVRHAAQSLAGLDIVGP